MGKYCDLHIPEGANVQPIFYAFSSKCDVCSNFAKWEDVPAPAPVIEEPIEA